jgi:hypothetical protein
MTTQVIIFNSQLYKNGNDYTAIQIGSSAESYAGSVAIGASAKATSNSIAIGNGAEASVANKIVIGNGSITNLSVGRSSLTIGEEGNITFEKIPAISSSFGASSFTGNQQIVSKAYVDSTIQTVSDNVTNNYATKGDYVQKSEIFKDGNVQIGSSSSTGENATAIGVSAVAGATSVAFGNATKTNTNSTAIRYNTDISGGIDNIGIGTGCKIEGTNSIVIGQGINLSKNNAIQIGNDNQPEMQLGPLIINLGKYLFLNKKE